MINRPSLSGINRDDVPGRVPCYSPTLHGRRSQNQAYFQLFGKWPQWIRQVVVLHSLLRNNITLCTEPKFSGEIICFYSDSNGIPSRHLVGKKHVRSHEGVKVDLGITVQLYHRRFVKGSLFKKVCVPFTKGSHHRNISIIVFTQNLFHKGRYCRGISLSANYFVVLKNVRDENQFSHLARMYCQN